jgi:anti-sigma B factor antagonist
VKIQERATGGVIILDMDGNLIAESRGEVLLPDVVRNWLQQGHRHFLLNLERVSSVDTTGLCDIVQAYVATTRQNGTLKLLHLTPRVRQVLTITRLLTVFEVYDTEENAVASFGPAAST